MEQAAIAAMKKNATYQDLKYMLQWISKIPTEHHHTNICDFVVENRYLPSNVSALAGNYSFLIFPMHEEITMCMDPTSPVRDVTVAKGVQTGFTTISENTILYYTVQQRGTPIMFVSSQLALAVERNRLNIEPMFLHSGYKDQIAPLDPSNAKKTGITDTSIEFIGGSYVLFRGAESKDSARSISIKVMIQDESSSYRSHGSNSQGDTVDLFNDRCAASWDQRKILRGSTPRLEETDPTWERFLKGDQRYYYVKCLSEKCRQEFWLRFRHKPDPATGIIGGLFWELDEKGNLIPESVRYHCPKCGHAHKEGEKIKLFSKENARWIPHNPLRSSEFRSYHMSALYSPQYFQPWHKCAESAIKARNWDTNETLNHKALESFYNNILGQPFRVSNKANLISLEKLCRFRRSFYYSGEIPNKKIIELNGYKLTVVTCAVDVQKEYLSVAVFGWAKGCSPYLIEYFEIKGETHNITDQSWDELEELIRHKKYYDDMGNYYKISLTAVDSGFQTHTIYDFVNRFSLTAEKGSDSLVVAIKGNDHIKNGLPFKLSNKNPMPGVQLYSVGVNDYKDLWASQFELNKWIDGSQADWTLNLPKDTTDEQIKELRCESKVLEVSNKTNKPIKTIWKRTGHVKNELWDLLVYNTFCFDAICQELMLNQMKEKVLIHDRFFDFCEYNDIFVNKVSK